MNCFKKIYMIALFILVLGFCSFGDFTTVVAIEEEIIYYEDKVLDTTKLPGGLKHSTVLGYSQVTDPTTIDGDAKEAGLGSTKPLILNQYYSQNLNILEIPKDAEVKIVPWAVFGNGYWTLARVTSMAVDYETSHPGWKVVAAVNGDFFDINGNNNLQYTPSGTIMVEGETYKVNPSWPMLGIDNSGNGDRFYGVYKDQTKTSSLPFLTIFDNEGNEIAEYEINKVNSEPGEGEIATYFPMFSSTHSIVPIAVEDAYIVEQAIDTVAFANYSLYGKGVISKIGNEEALGLNQFAIVTKNEEVKAKLGKDITIRVQFKVLSEGLENHDTIIGYHDNALVDGQPCYINDGYGNARLPRTLIGNRADGSSVMIVVDGRQPQFGYYGISNQETAALLQYYDVVDGFQMDGGGSATMVILKNGELQVVNSPSDSAGQTARSDGDCILVVMKVPSIEVELIKSFDKIEFAVDIIEMLEGYEDLYIDLNGEKKKVENGKVVFENLDSFTNYVYEFYSMKDGDYVSMVHQGKVTTEKITPTVDGLSINLVSLQGVDRYEISMRTTDPNGAITYAVLKVNGKKYWQSNGKFYYSQDMQSILNTDDWEIEISYNTQSGQGPVEEIVQGVPLYIDTVKAPLDAQKEKMDELMYSIFVNIE